MSAGLLERPAESADDFALIPLDAEWSTMEAQRGPKHTATRLKTNDPQRYDILTTALREGAAITTLARSHRVGVNTLYAIIDAELGGLDKYHADLAGKFRRAVWLGVDKVNELMPLEKDVMKAGVVTGIMADKLMTLSGLPTAIVRVEHAVNEETAKKLEDMIAALRRPQAMEAEVVEGDFVSDSNGDGSAPHRELAAPVAMPPLPAAAAREEVGA
jgi:hypothetical protein